MARGDVSRPAGRLSTFYAASFLVVGIQAPFWPVWLAGRGLGAGEIGIVLAAALWAKVAATPALGALADRLRSRRRLMAALAGVAFCAYAGLWPATGFAALLLLNLVAAAAQSALMPLGDAVTLAAARSGRIDYGRVRLWGSLSFILAALGSGFVLGPATGNLVLPLVLGASFLLLLACLAMPGRDAAPAAARRGGFRRIAGDRRFWLFAATAGMLQASHQVYYGFGTLYWRSLGFSDALIGGLWAEGVVAEIALFWLGGRLLARTGPLGLMALGGVAGILRWSLTGLLPGLAFAAALQLLHALTFGASHLGAMHFMARHVPATSATSAQALYSAISAGLGSGLVMLIAGALYGAYGGHAYLFMTLLSAVGLFGTVLLRRPSVNCI